MRRWLVVVTGALAACRGYYDASVADSAGEPVELSGGPGISGPATALDADGDGYIAVSGPDGLTAPDCDDADPARHPFAPEVCNLVDDDCDGQVDAADPDLSAAGGAIALALPGFLVAGQSNAVGAYAEWDALWPDEQWAPDNLAVWVDGAPAALAPPTSGSFGPELGFAQGVAPEPDGTSVVKRAEGGTSLKDDWAPGGRMLDALLDDAAAAAVCHDVQWEAVLWMQGGADAKRASDADAYHDNMVASIEAIRAELGDVAVIVGRSSGPLDVYPYMEEVAEAQADFVAGDPWACLVPTDDLPTVDGTHFDAEGQLTLGWRMAEAWRALQATGACP